MKPGHRDTNKGSGLTRGSNLLLPKILASLFAPSKNTSLEPAAEDNDEEKLKQHYQTYLDYRNKQEKLRSDSRSEIDKTIIAISAQSIVITLTVCRLLNLLPGLFLYIAWFLWVLAILITLLSIWVSEAASDLNIDVIDRALERAKDMKPVPDELPLAREIELEKNRFKKVLLKQQARIISFLNGIQLVLFVLALISGIIWGIQTTPMTSENKQGKEIVNYGQKPATLPKPLPKPSSQSTQPATSVQTTQTATDKKQ